MIHPATNPVIAARAGALKTILRQVVAKEQIHEPHTQSSQRADTEHDADHASHTPEEVQSHALGHKPYYGPCQS